MVAQCSQATAMHDYLGSNSEKLTRFKTAADTLMAFADEPFTEEIERQSQ